MAGLGRRTFAAGEVLTASNVMAYLQDQTVMNFAGTAARGSAIGTAVAEGMVSYLADSNTVEVYDGSAWKQFASALTPRGIVATTSGGTNNLSYFTATQDFAVNSTSLVDITGMSFTFTAVAGRLYRASFYYQVDTTSASQRYRLAFTDGSNNLLKIYDDQSNTIWNRSAGSPSHIFTASGTTTVKVRAQTVDAGTVIFAYVSPTRQTFIIEDIGPA